MAIEELAEEVVNEVASNLEEAAEVTRKLNTAGLGYLVVGLGIGAAVGFYFGRKWNKEKLMSEAYKDAEVEIAAMREVYLQKTVASVNADKPPVEEVVKELGYSVKVPERERPLKPPVPVSEVVEEIADKVVERLSDLPENPTGSSKSMNAGWNYEEELRRRTPQAPYVIHQNEYNHSEPEYSKVVYTYYDVDSMIIDEEESPLIYAGVSVGMDNLKFGHGSDDEDVVYVRNDRLETDMQICRVHRSYEEEVLGLQGVRDDDDDDDS